MSYPFLIQAIAYRPEINHDGKKLHCIYEQRDNEGNILFEGNQDDEDEITISVQFLQPSSNEVTRMVQTKVMYRLLHTNIVLYYTLGHVMTKVYKFICIFMLYGCRFDSKEKITEWK